MASYNIAIIGAGPSGCVLARLLLLKTSSKVTIFEAEQSSNARGQGGTLDLHENTGLLALRECGLYDDFLKYARFDGEAIKSCDKNMLNYINFGGTTATNSRGRPEIDRQSLRQILLDSILDEHVRWGHRLKSIREEETSDKGSSFSLHFEGNIPQQRDFDLIVGADGAWSKPRSLLTDIKPYYSGVFGSYFRISSCEARYPDIHEFVNRGSAFAFSNGKSITAQQMGDASIWVGVSAVRPQDFPETCGFDVDNAKEAKSWYLKDYADWAPLLRKIIEVVDEDYTMGKPLYMLPVEHRWKHRAGVTLIGDAAHLMTPYAGEGVNLAMRDAVNLARALTEAEESGSGSGNGKRTKGALDTRVKAFEEEMFVRAGRVALQSKNAMELMLFEEGAPRTTIERYIINMAKGDVPWVVMPVIYVGVYVWFFFYKLIYREGKRR